MQTATELPRHIDRRLIVIALHKRGVRVADICREFAIPKSTAYGWINDVETGKLPDPRDFAIREDHSRCDHQPIQMGELTVCVTCLVSGYDHRPEMQGKPLPLDRKKHKPGRLKGGK